MFGSGSQESLIGVVLVAGGLFVVLYVWTAMALAKLFAKLGDASASAWVPVVNIVTLLRLGEVNPATVLFLAVPVVQVIGIVFLVTAINTINRRFGLGTGMTVLGFFSLPIWASVLGFGSRVPIGGVGGIRPAIDRVVFETPAEASGPRWAPYVAPDVPEADLAADTPAAPVIDSVSLAVASAPAASQWQPPPLITPALITPPLITPAVRRLPVSPPPIATHGEPAAGDDPAASDLDLDKTVVGRRHRTQRWHLTAEGSTPIKLIGASALIGRNPAASVDYPLAQLVTLADPDKTVSKTHAHLSLVDGRWSIIDLNSTNGVYVMSASGDETEIEIGIGVQATESFRLGDLTITLSTEGSPYD